MAFFFDVFGVVYGAARDINDIKNEDDITDQLKILKKTEKASKEQNNDEGYIRLFLLAFVYAQLGMFTKCFDLLAYVLERKDELSLETKATMIKLLLLYSEHEDFMKNIVEGLKKTENNKSS